MKPTTGHVILFGPDGFLYPCTETVGDRSKAIGEYDKSMFLDKDALKLWRTDITEYEECPACVIATYCGGSCTVSTMCKNDRGIHCRDCNNHRRVVREYLAYSIQNFIDGVDFELPVYPEPGPKVFQLSN